MASPQDTNNATFFLDVPEDKKGFFGKSEEMVYAKDGEADFNYDSTLQEYVEIIGKTWDSKFNYGDVVKLSEYEAEIAIARAIYQIRCVSGISKNTFRIDIKAILTQPMTSIFIKTPR